MSAIMPPRAAFVVAKRLGYSDVQIAGITGRSVEKVGLLAREWRVKPAYKLVDTCAAEFEAFTPYYYSTYETPPLQLGQTRSRASSIPQSAGLQGDRVSHREDCREACRRLHPG